MLSTSLLAPVMLAAVASRLCSVPWGVRRLPSRSLLAVVVVVMAIGSQMTAAAAKATTSAVDTSAVAARFARYTYDTAAIEHRFGTRCPYETPNTLEAVTEGQSSPRGVAVTPTTPHSLGNATNMGVYDLYHGTDEGRRRSPSVSAGSMGSPGT